jgi:adenylate cyclase
LYPIQITIAEIELSTIKEKIKVPPWVGDEVTGDPKYFNSEIIKMGI